MEHLISFNKPYLTGKEVDYIADAVDSGHISGNGKYTKLSQAFFEKRYGLKKTLLTTSCTDALEMCAMLLDIKPGDEVIVPSFTFVSSALAFVRQGANIVFADSTEFNPNIDADALEQLITSKTKAIVVVHYAGVACDMGKIMSLAEKHNIYVVEDAAQAIESTYNGKQLGGIGHLGCFSFHETKNIQCGEGGLLIINDEKFINRAEILWEKGTNRAEFFRGEVNKYGWVDTGSSFLPSELNAAFLFAQLENIEEIQKQRLRIWNTYYTELKPLSDEGGIEIKSLPEYAFNNAHMFYILLPCIDERSKLIAHLKQSKVMAVFHYLSLHKSSYYNKLSVGENIPSLPFTDDYSDRLLRLPLYYELDDKEIEYIINLIRSFFNKP